MKSNMRREELLTFMKQQRLDKEALAEVLGVTPSGVDHWLSGIRSIPETTAKVIRLFKKKPDIMREF